MPDEKRPEFRLRLPPELKADILDFMAVKGLKSMNALLNKWIREKVYPDETERLVEAIRPALESLDEEERDRFVEHAVAALQILAKGSARSAKRKR